MPKKSVRARRRKPGFYYIAFLTLSCMALALIIAIVLSSSFRKIEERSGVLTADNIPPQETDDAHLVIGGDFFETDPEAEAAPEAAPQAEAEAEPETAPEATAAPDAQPAVKREGYLPVYTKADIQENKIAITVDECGAPGIVKNFCDNAVLYGAKLTFFPVGEFLEAAGMDTLFSAIVHQYGFEVENRGQTGMGRVYRMNDEELVGEIWQQNAALNLLLDEEYTMHFFRPFGANGIDDAHVQYVLKQLGYYGTVGWSAMGSTLTSEKLPELVTPGSIFFFKSSSADLEKAKLLMEYCQNNGFEMVTLNELFGLEPNACEPSDDLIFGQKTPEIPPYVPVLHVLADGENSYDVFRLQQRLAELNYTTDTPDGVFGTGTSGALRLFQSACGKAATGIADIAIQELLFSDDAPARQAEVLYE